MQAPAQGASSTGFPCLLVPNLQRLAPDGVEDGQKARLIRVLEPTALDNRVGPEVGLSGLNVFGTTLLDNNHKYLRWRRSL